MMGGWQIERKDVMTWCKESGSGKWQTGQSQKPTTFTTLTETSRTITCPTCNLSFHLSITLCTNGNEKTTELSQMGQRPDAVNDATSIDRSTGIISVQQGHMVAIAKIAAVSTCVSGTPDTPTIARSTAASSGNSKNVSRFFPQFDWAAEVAERLALTKESSHEDKLVEGSEMADNIPSVFCSGHLQQADAEAAPVGSEPGKAGTDGNAHGFVFNQVVAERLANSDQVRYEPKAPRTQRNAGLAEAGLIMPKKDLTAEQRDWLYAELERRGVSVA